MKKSNRKVIRSCFLLLFNFIPILFYAQTTTITISKKNITLKKLLSEIKRQTNYNFIIDPQLLNLKEVENVNFNKWTIRAVVDTILHPRGISYGIDGHTIAFIRSNVAARGAIPSKDTVHNHTHVYYGKPVDILSIPYDDTISNTYNIGDITQIKDKHLDALGYTNFIQQIAGKTPGAFIQSFSGIAGTSVKTTIGGRNSISSGYRPLYIIDGVPFDDIMYGALGSNLLDYEASVFNFINPLDIESIVILKDADATSIYGSRAACGAILITTTKGKKGEPLYSYLINYSIANVPRYADLMSTNQFLHMREEAARNDSMGQIGDDLNQYSSTSYTNWQKKLIGQTAKSFSSNFNVSGGSDQLQYFLSGTYRKTTLPFPGPFYNQMVAVHLNNNIISNDKRLQISTSGSFSSTDMLLPGQDLINYSYIAPNSPEPFINGQLNYDFLNNPYIALIGPIFKANVMNMFGNITFQYQIIRHLTFKTSMGHYLLLGESTIKTPLTIFRPEMRRDLTGSLFQYQYKASSRIVEPQLLYRNALGNWHLDVVLGFSLQNATQKRGNQLGYGFTNDAQLDNITYATTVNNDVTSSLYKYGAAFTSIRANYKKKLLLHTSFRRDGSSRYSPAHRYASCGSLGIGYIFTEDTAVKKRLPFLSFGKIRSSIGRTGNDQIGDYRYMVPFYEQPSTYQNVQGYTSSSVYNNSYTWELTRKFEIGTDLSFLKNRLSLTVNHYNNTSTNQIVMSPLPEMTGVSGIIRNIPAVVKNIGWDFTLQTDSISIGNVHWSSQLNISILKNKLTQYPGTDSNLTKFEGHSLTSVYVYKLKGVNEKGEFQFDNGTPEGTTKTDSLKRTHRIDLFPRLYGGFSNSFTWKHFTLDCLWYFVVQQGKRDQLDPNILPGNPMQNQNTMVLNHWPSNGNQAVMMRYTQKTTLRPGYTKALESNLNYTDASYISLRTIMLSYAHVHKSWHMNSVFFIKAQNLFTLTRYPGMDPETQSRTATPQLREFMVGVRLQYQKNLM